MVSIHIFILNNLFTQVDRVTKKMLEDKKEYDLKMQEYAQLLDIRADRIRVRNILYDYHMLILINDQIISGVQKGVIFSERHWDNNLLYVFHL